MEPWAGPPVSHGRLPRLRRPVYRDPVRQHTLDVMFQFRHLITSRYLDLEMHRVGNLRVRIVERPGMWMAPGPLQRIVADLQSVVAATLDQGALNYGAVSGDPERLKDAILTVLYDRETDEPVAFNALSVLRVTLRGREEEVLHTGLAMVDPTFRGKGISWVLYGLTVMLIFCHRQLRPIWISNVTQVPSVFGMVAESFENVFPLPDPSRRPTRAHIGIARQIMERHRNAFGVGEEALFHTGQFVIVNSYTGGSDNLKKSYDEAPKHRRDEYNRMCLEQLDYDRGDDFLQIGRWTLSTAQRYLLRSVPRYSLGSILSWAGFLILGSILLPVFHWFTPGQQLGELRPWKG